MSDNASTTASTSITGQFAVARAHAVGRIGLWTGVGLVVANMVGSGVLTTAGYMADSLGPLWILAAWAIGGVVALAGAAVYAQLAHVMPESGGEYRYLSRLIHPYAGYVAGWTSLLVGFSAPVAMAAMAAGAYLSVLLGVDATLSAIAVVVVITALHGLHLRTSSTAQDALVAVKIVLLISFIAVGLWTGSNQMPAWTAQQPTGLAGTLGSFFNSLVYIGFCYSGWNAVTYVAAEFKHPRRDVWRAMWIGTVVVIAVYLAVNWVFVANLTPADLARIKTEDEKLTLGHLVLHNLVGPNGAAAMSSVVLVALVSSLSAMTLVGPRVYAAMARDGYLPRFFAGRDDAAPLASVVLQSGVAIVLVLTQNFSVLLNNAGSVLTLTSMAAVVALLVRRNALLSVGVKVAAGIYIVFSSWALLFSVRETPSTLLWAAAILALAAGGYKLARRTAAAGMAEAVPVGAEGASRGI
ncbi:MAG: APC family permease [Deltaproteobacteria bacterium]|nr:APC family permease [Deltaproteobacteria bacterium]